MDGLPDLILGLAGCFLELVNGFGDTTREIGYALGTEEHQNDQEDENEFSGPESEKACNRKSGDVANHGGKLG